MFANLHVQHILFWWLNAQPSQNKCSLLFMDMNNMYRPVRTDTPHTCTNTQLRSTKGHILELQKGSMIVACLVIGSLGEATTSLKSIIIHQSKCTCAKNICITSQTKRRTDQKAYALRLWFDSLYMSIYVPIKLSGALRTSKIATGQRNSMTMDGV